MRSAPVLADAVKSAEPTVRDRLRVALGLARARGKDARGALREVEGIDPAAVPEVRSVRISALLDLKRFADADREIESWLRAAPADSLALWYAMRQGVRVDDLARIDGPARKLIAAKKRTAEAENTLAWAKFCHGRVDEDALQLAQASAKARPSAESNNTLATLFAESGRLEEARKAVLVSIDAHDNESGPGPADRYVLARIWEAYGLDDVALPRYRELSAPGEASGDRACVAAAARRRLEALGRAVQ